MKIAFSPCPNDTFIFHAWVHGLIPGAPKLEVTYADIDITNKLAATGEGPDIIKISYAALPWVLSEYALLPCGGALGRGCGPLLLTAKAGAGSNENVANNEGILEPKALAGRRVAVPSDRSTAYLLFRLWLADNVPGGVGEITVMPFHEIMPAVRDGAIDAGLVIHEARFTYPSYGLGLLVDLGRWWEEKHNLPIPLGAIVARRSLDLNAIAKWIRASVNKAWAEPELSQEYILAHAQEMALDVVKAHIGLYVNQYSENLGEEGYRAVEMLLGQANEAGLVPQVDLAALRI